MSNRQDFEYIILKYRLLHKIWHDVDYVRKFPKVNTKVVKGEHIIGISTLNLQAKQQLITPNDMRKIVTCLLLSASALLNPIITKAADERKTDLALNIQYGDVVDKENDWNTPRKSPAYIPIQASYDTHYIYVSSQASISGKYVVVDSNDGKALEGVFATTPGEERKININSLSEGDYKLEVTLGELTLEGDFHVGE